MIESTPRIVLALALVMGCNARSTDAPASGAANLAFFELPDPVLNEFEPEVSEDLRSRHAQVVALALVSDAEYGPALGELGRAYHGYGLVAVAYDCYDEAFRRTGEIDWAHLAGYAAVELANDSAAADWFETVVASRPESCAGWIQLGEARLTLNALEASRAAFEMALVVDPSQPRAWFGLGRVDVLEDKFESAVECFERALQLAPGADAIYYPLAQAYRGLGDATRARELLALWGDRRPALPASEAGGVGHGSAGVKQLVDRATRLGQAGRFGEAVPLLREALARRPDDVTARFYLGFSLLSLGRAQAALDVFLHVTESDPAHDRAQLYAGMLIARAGDDSRALEYFERSVTARPGVEVHLRMARALQRLSRDQDALEHYDRAVEIAPANRIALVGQAVARISTGRWSEARNGLEQAIALAEDEPTLYALLARILAAAPDPSVRDGERSLALCRGLAELGEDPDLAATIAMAMAETGRFDEASAWQQTAISMLRAGDARRSRFAELAALYGRRVPCREPWQPADPIFSPPSQVGPLQP